MTLADDIRKDREKLWYPTRTDSAWFDRLREDYEDKANWSDDQLREYFDGYQDFSVTWDNIGDAYNEYEPLANSFLRLEAAYLRERAAAEELANALHAYKQAESTAADPGTQDDYDFVFECWDKIEAALTAYRKAVEDAPHD